LCSKKATKLFINIVVLIQVPIVKS
jgi:hypothetical protein